MNLYSDMLHIRDYAVFRQYGWNSSTTLFFYDRMPKNNNYRIKITLFPVRFLQYSNTLLKMFTKMVVINDEFFKMEI